MPVHCLFTMLVDGETGGTKRMHHDLPVYRPFHFIALLFEVAYFQLCYGFKG